MLQGLWRRGSVLEGRVQVRGGVWQPHALPSEVRGTRGRWLLQRLRLPLGPRRSTGLVRPGILALTAVSRVRFAWKSLYAPFLVSWGHQHACMGKRPVSRGEVPSAFNIGGDEGFIHVRCASSHAARPGCFSASPLSHSHSRREPGEGRC